MNPSPRSTPPTVQVPRGTLAALVVALFAAVVGVAFLAGRECGRGQPPAPTTMAAASALPASAGPPPASIADTDAPTPPEIEVPTPAAFPPASAVAAGPSFAPPALSQSAPDTLRDQVATYFREVEAIQSQGKSSSDPQAFARALLEQGAKGDVSGFDALAGANKGIRDALRTIAVPEPCREHHRRTLALIEESVAMLERVKGQMQGSDEGSLTALPAQGLGLEREAKEVDALAAEIKRRFGL